ncbi:MAG TPA: DNA repair protein RecO [Acidimicrobiia bacterium]|jgi:DNA repair protein RecO (recombination protein O)
MLRHDRGIVLRSYPFGEADRIVVLISPHNGKLRTVAKGVRKTKSRIGGRLESFSDVDLVLYEGRNLDIVNQVSVRNTHAGMRSELDRVTAASTMAEGVDAVAQEDEPSVALFELLSAGLSALDTGPAHPDLVTAFLLQLAAVVGLAPSLDVCAGCGRDTGLDRFSFGAGGVVCESCRPDGAVRLRPGLTSYLARLAESDFDRLPEPDPGFTGDAMGVVRRFMEFHLERRFASLAVLGS